MYEYLVYTVSSEIYFVFDQFLIIIKTKQPRWNVDWQDYIFFLPVNVQFYIYVCVIVKLLWSWYMKFWVIAFFV